MNGLRRILGPPATFFGHEPSGSLSLFRLLYCLINGVTVALYAADFDRKHSTREYSATPLFELISAEPLPHAFCEALRIVVVASFLLAALGILTRPALVIAAISFFLYEGTHLGFTKPIDSDYVYHLTNLTVFFPLVMAMAPGIGRHSLISILRRDNAQVMIPEWPRKAMIGMFAFAYFGAGWQRLIADPLWVDGYTLQAYLLDKAMRYPLPLGFEIAQHWWLCVVFSVFTMGLELTYPIVLFFPRFKFAYLVNGLILHAMILLTMDINFFEWFAYNYLVLLELSWFARIAARMRGRPWTPPPLPAPQSRVPTAQRFACVAWIALQAGCVFIGIEKWPLSDFRVFRDRRHPDDVSMLYFTRVENGEEVELPWRKQQMYRRAVTSKPEREIRAALEIADEAARRARLEAIGRDRFYGPILRADPRAFDKWGSIYVIQKRPVRDPVTARFSFEEREVLELEPPGV
jgi:hypothetical protein